MAKKNRKQRKAPRLSQAQLVQPEPVDDALAKSDKPLRASTKVGLSEEYRYVVADIRRIAIIAVVMLAVMITLAMVTVQ